MINIDRSSALKVASQSYSCQEVLCVIDTHVLNRSRIGRVIYDRRKKNSTKEIADAMTLSFERLLCTWEGLSLMSPHVLPSVCLNTSMVYFLHDFG